MLLIIALAGVADIIAPMLLAVFAALFAGSLND